ncbi:hydantoinase/carbamoylase family amidase [Pseudomonas sp. FSL R10-1350]|uniref:Hydantoinase/carbamoylase family amidase n=1 Tax=Pseudomonas helleri TaxID=1608996 RepID=A0A6A7YAN8_9PSED|nr:MULTISPECIES: Zn-dependent hydrolase [Pseudomonas]MQT29755.1 hydantoinase/carbamoylase family amidase [Pseudomonas helleri]MQT46583.1 hydantoinase/carbamoylase family amidase [Pseudomonas helleri]MQT58562.1 hydantoinase/carbamoylase family amidase [Pseudomonas sp. FSL R10-0399]MQT88868.1 hydantoinase/carbamoylase family amidase [Pseudomonas helleri]MQU65377.1 hydantoinase/carbamoylase family amidase [Pseudomonas sp. FSL R10-1350]
MNAAHPLQQQATQSINGERLWASLMELAKLGATVKGGVCRLALTDLDRQARDIFVRWCEDAGCTVSVDAVGNIFARRPGLNPDLPPVMTGSHIDTQPTGGKFDGCFGVLAGVEVLRTLNDLNIQTQAPIEVVVWTNEEGSRFAPCMMGSGVFAEKFTLEETLAKTDAQGVTVGEALNAIGYAGSRKVSGHPVGAYFEAHIEQGPILEDERKTIGVVLGALGQKWFDLNLRGVEAHAGPTPMHLRKDALVGAAAVVAAVNKAALGHQPHACGTVGCLQAYPGSRNVIPGEVRMTLDFRHLQPERLDSMISEVREVIEATCAKHGLSFELTPTADFPPLYFNPDCVNAVRNAASELGLSHMDIVSGAGHDAIFLAELGPAGMIFVPCEGGISHNEIENADPKDLAAGCAVLLKAMLAASETVAAQH